jgi:superfamily II DNA or RNA helicase
MSETIRLKKKNHSYLQIDTDDRGVLAELSEFFTFKVPGAEFMPAYKNRLWDGKIRLVSNRDNTIYAGLYDYIQAFAAAEGRGYEIEDLNDPVYGPPRSVQDPDLSFVEDIPLSAKGQSIRPRDYQLEAVAHALTNKRAMLLSPTASGKSLIIYLLCRWYMDNHDGRILIVVPTTSLVEQMYGDFADYSTHDSDFDIEKAAHRIYGGQDKNNQDARIMISTWQSIYKMPQQWFREFGCVIGDEAHNFKAKSLTSVLTKCTEAEYRFGTTGTLDGTQTHKLVLEGLFGPVYNVTTTKELMDEGSLASLDINVLLLKYPDAVCKEMKGTKYQEEIDFLVSNEARNKFIRNLALDQSGNTLVLFQYVEKHGKPLHDLIRQKAADDRQVFFVSGGTDVEGRERVRQITENEKDAIIVASMGVFSTGINIRNIHNVVFASPSKSQIRVLQSIGRGLRKADDGRDTTLYDIADDLHWKKHKNYTLNHSAARIKIYSKERFKFKIYEIPLS